MGGDGPIGVATGLGTAWSSVPHPVVVVTAAGTVRAVSPSTQALLPSAVPGADVDEVTPPWLAQAHRRLAQRLATHDFDAPAVSGAWNGARLEARPTVLDGEIAWWLIEDADRELTDTQEALSREQARTAFLDEASAVLMATLNVDRCMSATVQLATRHLADAAAVVSPVAGNRLPVVCGDRGGVEQRTVETDPAVVAGLSEALRGFPPVPSRWLDPASLPEWLIPSTFGEPVGSVLITPLPGLGVPAGALVLLRRASVFGDDEELSARLFAARAGAALSAAGLYAEQSKITRTLMRDLVPPQLRRLHGFELAGGYRASEDHQVVGGDFYDVHPGATPEDDTLVVLGDVCGKGLEAAVLTGKIRNTLQALAPLAQDHRGVLGLLNSALLSTDHTRFATLVLASVARRDGQVALRLTSAGHCAPLIVRCDGRVEEADTRGQLVGVLEKIQTRTFETTLAPGETCVLYTDGVTEAWGGPLGTDMFGEQRLAAALEQCAGMPAEAVVERIMMLTTQWVSRREHDDIAVVAITAPRRTHLSAVDGHTAGRYTA
ncbi:serine/threonine protein phosphatase [Mycobacterium sp. IS-1742]|uniref:PP2C family protein-serine/threonine phosphatase n=1 Tax=Mycobacterium sp. IS-1742 TaxID=1772285 RepID=UPI00074046D0|nr:PP2C family protein-serine/threonine phosphatase [Mycobacterium sp. IS-1742]KUI29158.1 serine/threonine protein phosphatase [Mycobacterium sp. IS-1742]